MKIFWKIVLIAVVSLAAVHLFILWQNHSLHQSLVQNKASGDPVKEFDMKTERLALEAAQRKKIESYEWIDKRKGHVQIPVERAFDYYLRSLRTHK